MAASKLVATVTCYWEEGPGEMSKCMDCGDIIYTHAHYLVYYHQAAGQQANRQVGEIYCDACFLDFDDATTIDFEPWSWDDFFSDS